MEDKLMGKEVSWLKETFIWNSRAKGKLMVSGRVGKLLMRITGM